MLAFREKDVKFNLGNGEQRMDETWSLPSDYDEGWMNLVLVVDRENEKVGVSIDFGEIEFRDIDENFLGATFEGISDVNIGQDGTGGYSYSFDGDVDEIIIFEKPLADWDIVNLAAYYGVAID